MKNKLFYFKKILYNSFPRFTDEESYFFPSIAKAMQYASSLIYFNILSASCKTTRQRTGILDFIIEVKNSLMLKELLYSISKLQGVSKAYRVEKSAQDKK